MRTGNQQRYYDILRRENATHKTAQRSATPVSTFGTPVLAGTAASDFTAATARITATARGRHNGPVATTADAAASSSSPSPTKVYDPIAELGLPSTAVPAVVELSCARRGFTVLHPNFLRFELLRSLVVEHNAFESLHHLLLPPPATALPTSSSLSATPQLSDSASAVGWAAEFTGHNDDGTGTRGLRHTPAPPLHRGCRRLTHLHASHNCLRDIVADTDIARLLLLEHLSLAHNQLTNLSRVLHALRRLRCLRFLDLRGNPVTGEPQYRQRCIAALPQVEVLDCQVVTPKERDAAAGAHADRPASHGTTRRLTDGDGAQHGSGHQATAGGRPGTTTATTRALTATAPSSRSAVDPFTKSRTARDLERKYIAYLRRRQDAEEAAAQEGASARRTQQETWEALHAVWSLSQVGMPLSADGWQKTQAAAAAAAAATSAAAPSPATVAGAGGESGEGDAERRDVSSSFSFPRPSVRPRSPNSRAASTIFSATSPLLVGHTATSSGAAAAAAAAATAATNTGAAAPVAAAKPPVNVVIDVPGNRPLFPPSMSNSSFASVVAAAAAAPTHGVAAATPRARSSRGSSMRASSGLAVVALPTLHDSIYFRTVRGSSPAPQAAASLPQQPPLPEGSRMLPAAGPDPDRLATLQCTLRASTEVVRAAAAATQRAAAEAAGAKSAGAAAGRSAVPPAGASAATQQLGRDRAASGRRTLMAPPSSKASLAAASAAAAAVAAAAPAAAVPVEFSTLRVIQETKYAVIPPPWEASTCPSASQGSHMATPTTPGPLHAIGTVSAATAQQEALAEVLALLYDFYAPEELSALEGEYGGAELLRLLPPQEWLSTTDTVSPAVAARQVMKTLSRPDSASNAAAGGAGAGAAAGSGGNAGGGSRSAASPAADRKRGPATKGAPHGGGAGGSLTSRGGQADAAGGPATATAALAAARATLPVDPHLVWQLLTGPLIVAGSSPGVVVAYGKGAQDKTGGGTAAGAAAPSAVPFGGAGASAAPGAGGTAAAAAGGPPPPPSVGGASPSAAAAAGGASLQDPEAVQHLVRPLGAYEPHVLGPLLSLLRAPITEAQEQAMCDAIARFHAVHERVTAAAASAVASVTRASTAEPLPRWNAGNAAAVRGKGDSLSASLVAADDAAGGGGAAAAAEARRKKASAAAARSPLSSPASSPSPSLASSLSAQALAGRSSAKAAQLLQQQLQQQLQLQLQRTTVTAQLSLVAVLTALLFSPAFVRSRVALMEEQLAGAATATAAAGVITAVDHVAPKRVAANAAMPPSPSASATIATPARLSRLFQRVQAVRMHATRLDAATAAPGPSTAPHHDVFRFVEPNLVLAAFAERNLSGIA